MSGFKRAFRELTRYPTAIFGLVIVLALVVTAIYTLIALPRAEAVRLWRGGENIWGDTPKNARPVWVNWFTAKDLPVTRIMDSREIEDLKVVQQLSATTTQIDITFNWDFKADEFPDEVIVYIDSTFDAKQPLIELLWITPDGREIPAGRFTARSREVHRLSLDERLVQRLGGVTPRIGLYADPNSPDTTPVPLNGEYTLIVSGVFFEPDVNMDAKFVQYGQLYGLAGTDHRRRDLTIALLWGTPIALGFGLFAALGTSIITMAIAAIGVWFGGFVDAAIQRITEVNLILPTLPILIMVGTFYNRSIWTMLGVIIALSIFGGAIKTYRAIFLQVKESPYIEAARSYGAGNFRIIFRYLIPRIIPLLIPGLVTAIPAFVFLEASLAVLGLGDPVLPTWGKIIDDARTNGALYNGYFYWVLEPAALLMVTGLGFAMLGFALDRVFNPRLRGM